MKPFARLPLGPLPLVASIALGLAIPVGRAGADDETLVKSPPATRPATPPKGGDPAKAPEDDEAGESPEVRGLALLPVGKTNLGVRLPVFEGAKQTMLFQAAEMTPTDNEEVAMKGVEIRILNDEGAEDTRIVMSSSRYLVPIGLLSSDEKTVIHGSDYTLTGATLDFDAKKKFGVMRGPVKMILRDFNKLKGGADDGKVLEEKKTENGGAATPEASTQPATATKNEAISPESPKP